MEKKRIRTGNMCMTASKQMKVDLDIVADRFNISRSQVITELLELGLKMNLIDQIYMDRIKK